MNFSMYKIRSNMPLNFLVPVFTTSRFGKPVLLLAWYRYKGGSRSRGPKFLWRCSKSGSGSAYCKAYVTTWGNIVIKYSKQHNH